MAQLSGEGFFDAAAEAAACVQHVQLKSEKAAGGAVAPNLQSAGW
jgi:hypothetical protein